MDEELLFVEQNAFVYDMFLTNIRTSMGEFFIRTYENSRDAQSVWRDYLAYMETSSRAELHTSKLMTEITTNKLDANYKGTTQASSYNGKTKSESLRG